MSVVCWLLSACGCFSFLAATCALAVLRLCGAALQLRLIFRFIVLSASCTGLRVYLAVPARRRLTPGHCLLVPVEHTTAATSYDENVAEEDQVCVRAFLCTVYV